MKSIETTYRGVRDEIKKIIIGQDGVIELLFISVLCGGHSIIEGVPGLAKTLIINSLARTLDLTFNRIQFTPDMVPSDITGTEVLTAGVKEGKSFRFIKGPVFSNIVLADEINRTPPKTQSALLQAMQERQVTVLGETYELPDPFFVMATQNPIEYEGTYPLPEAQLDRFLLFIYIDYPKRDEEFQIIGADSGKLSELRAVIDAKELKKLTGETRNIPVSDKVKDYAVELVRGTRPSESKLGFVKNYIEWGAGPRATQMLVRAAQARAAMDSKKMVDKEDIDSVLIPVLKHRIIPNYNAVSERIDVSDLIGEIRKKVEAVL
ncbi:MAG: AAA family ATPase [Spirochaetes bacterium GWF1_49_6]|nr:MAG: AAA family ATPase [Spirochaetes bacterium GWF1_49_6]